MNNTDKRVGAFGSICIFGAYGLTCSVAQTGALVGKGAAFTIGFWGLLIGAIAWGIFAFGSAYIGNKTGVCKDIVWKNVFGRYGSKLVSTLVGLSLFFWGGYDTFIAAQAVGNLFPADKFYIGFAITVLLVVFITIIGCIKGIPGIKWISIISVPIALFLFAKIIIGTVDSAGGWAAISQVRPQAISYNSVWDIVHLFIGCWLAGLMGIHDFGTGVKRPRDLAAGTFAGGIITCFCFLVGFFGTIATGQDSIGNICLSIGGAIWICGCLFTFVAQANTQPGAALFYCNSISTALNVKFKPVGIIVPCLCGVEAFWVMYGGDGVATIVSIMNAVGIIVSPIFGTVLAEFYIVGKRNIDIADDESKLPTIKPAGVISVVAGIIIATLLLKVRFYVFITILAVAAIHTFLRLVIKLK